MNSVVFIQFVNKVTNWSYYNSQLLILVSNLDNKSNTLESNDFIDTTKDHKGSSFDRDYMNEDELGVIDCNGTSSIHSNILLTSENKQT